MPAHPCDIVHIAAARDQVGSIGIKRLPHCDRSAFVGIGIGILAATCQLAGAFLRLPEGQDLLAICFFVIVRKAKLFDPIAAFSVSRDRDDRRSDCRARIRNGSVSGIIFRKRTSLKGALAVNLFRRGKFLKRLCGC